MKRLNEIIAWIDAHGGKAAALAAWATQGAAIIASFLSARLLLRDYDAAGAGIWSFILSCTSFFQLCDFGLTQSISRQISFSLGKRQQGGKREKGCVFVRSYGPRAVAQLYVDSLRLFRGISILVGVVGILLERTVLFSGKMEASPEAHVTWYLIVGMAILNNENRPEIVVLTGCLHVAWLRVVGCAASVTQSFLFIVALWLGAPLWAAGTVYFGVAALQRLAIHRLFRRKVTIEYEPKPKRAVLWALWLMSWQQGVATTASFFIFLINPILSGYFLGPAQLFAYVFYSKIASMGFSALLEMIAPQTNFMVKLISDGSVDGLLTKFFKVLFVTAALGFVGFFSLAVLGHYAARLLAGRPIEIPQVALILLCVYNWIALVQTQCACFLLAHGQQRFAVIASVGAVINLALALALMPKFGVTGGILATALAQLLTSNWYIIRLCVQRLQGYAAKCGNGALFDSMRKAIDQIGLGKVRLAFSRS